MSCETQPEHSAGPFSEWFDEVPPQEGYLNPESWTWMRMFIPTVAITSVVSEPLQLNGYIQGYPFHYRDHLGLAILNVGALGADFPYTPTETLYTQSMDSQTGDEIVRVLPHLLYLIPRLERSGFPWSFMGQEVEVTPNGDTWTFEDTGLSRVYTAWGFTAGEAYQRLHDVDPFMTNMMGISPEEQHKLFALRAIIPDPLEMDTRVWPEQDPEFSSYSES